MRWKLYDKEDSHSEMQADEDYYEVEVEDRDGEDWSVLTWRCTGSSDFKGIFHVHKVHR